MVARVFHLKKNALLKKIKNGFFGDLAAKVYTIEFQKRGLPHMHLLIFLAEPYKIRDAAAVDSIGLDKSQATEVTIACTDAFPIKKQAQGEEIQATFVNS